MSVQHELRLAQGFWAQRRSRRHIESFEHRVDADPVAVPDAIVEAHRLAVGEDEINLGVRHAQRFDSVLDRGGSSELMLEGYGPVLLRKKVVQLGVKAEY